MSDNYKIKIKNTPSGKIQFLKVPKYKVVRKLKQIKLLGKKYIYENNKDLSKKLKLTETQTQKLINDSKNKKTRTRFIKNKDGEFTKYDIRDKLPLLTQEFGILRPSKTLLKSNQKIKNNIIYDKIPKDQTLTNLNFIIYADIIFSDEYLKKKIPLNNFKGTLNELTTDFINNYIREYFNFNVGIKNIRIEATNFETEEKFNIIDQELFKQRLSLKNIFNEEIDPNKYKDCVVDFMKDQYPRLSKNKIEKLRTTRDILNFCKNLNIKMLCYDINGNIICANYPTKKNKVKNCIFRAYNSHLYPLKNQTLNKTNINIENVEMVDNAELELIKFLDSGILPKNICCKDNLIYSFEIGNTIYTENKEYKICLNYLTKKGLKDKMRANIDLSNIFKIFEEVYIKENINSFLPPNYFIKGGFTYNNEKIESEYITIDKNKCYVNELKNLKSLISCDYKTANIEIEPKEIIEHYLYIARPYNSSILLPNTNIYSGEFLLYCRKEGLKFVILEGIETTRHDNYYKNMIDDLYDLMDIQDFKKMVNINIGKFEMYSEKLDYNNFEKVVDNENAKYEKGFKQIIGGKYTIISKNKRKVNIINKKPINIQIKDNSRKTIYEFMKKLKLTDDDIKQVKTDSITIKKKSLENIDYMKYINKDKINMWKLEEYKPIQTHNFYNNAPLSFVMKENKNNKKNILYNCYAGVGKSYKIMNEDIPKIKDKSYIVLTPSHATLKEYKKKNFNCDVIQKYTLTNETIKEDIIIIDEIGMIDGKGWNLLYMLKCLGKEIIGYGDFKQLPSFNGLVYDKKHFINTIFGTHKELTTNYRNNFSNQYYNSLIYSDEQEYLIKEVDKYNSNIEDAEILISHTNINRHKYNERMCIKNNISYNKNDKGEIKIGEWSKKCPIICKTNNLRKLNIYNKFTFNIKSCSGDMFILDDGRKILKKDIINNFDFAYCRTLYSIQGETLKSFHYIKEDYKFLNNRFAYTLISRLKQEKK